MKIINTNFNFKGYDAAPLKKIHMAEYMLSDLEEMKSVAEKENIELNPIETNIEWVQDDTTAIEKDGKTHISKTNMLDLTPSFITGGNMFIGKYPNGQKWMIVGSLEMGVKGNNNKGIGERYGVEPRNVHAIPQMHYHLDISLRPIGYPYILVNDPKRVRRHLNEIKDDSQDFKTLEENFNETEGKNINNNSTDKVCIALKQLGFKTIRIAGVWGMGINFLNALVNKHDDNTLSYITNSSNCDSELYSKIEKIFEKDLREKIDNIDSVYFIKGNSNRMAQKPLNYMMTTVLYKQAGIHCYCSEEPNFDKWV